MRKEGNGGVKIIPRVLVEGWTMTDFQEVFASESKMSEVAEFVVRSLQVSIVLSDKYFCMLYDCLTWW